MSLSSPHLVCMRIHLVATFWHLPFFARPKLSKRPVPLALRLEHLLQLVTNQLLTRLVRVPAMSNACESARSTPVWMGWNGTSASGSTRQFSILDPVRLVGLGAKASMPIRLVVLVVAFEPDHLAVALERQ